MATGTSPLGNIYNSVPVQFARNFASSMVGQPDLDDPDTWLPDSIDKNNQTLRTVGNITGALGRAVGADSMGRVMQDAAPDFITRSPYQKADGSWDHARQFADDLNFITVGRLKPARALFTRVKDDLLENLPAISAEAAINTGKSSVVGQSAKKAPSIARAVRSVASSVSSPSFPRQFSKIMGEHSGANAPKSIISPVTTRVTPGASTYSSH